MMRTPSILTSACLALLGILINGKSSGAAADVLAFVDVAVVPMARNALLPHQTVLIKGEQIVGMGPVATIRIPTGATRISGAGRYLMPGLIDMHVHFFRQPADLDLEDWRFPDFNERNEDFGLLFVANGVTSVRQMHAHPAGDRLMSRSLGANWLGPRIYSTGPITDGDPPEWPIARVVKTPDDAMRAVAADKAAGYVAIKVYDALSLPLYDAIVAAAAQVRLDVVGHVPESVGLARVIAANQWTIEHTDSFLLSLQPGAGPYALPPADLTWAEAVRRADLSKLPQFGDAIRRAAIWVCPTIVTNQMYSTDDTWSSELRFVPAAISAKFVRRYSGGDSHDFAQDLEFSLAVVAGLHARGAGLLLGSDTFKMNVVPGFSALQELQYFTRAGLSPYEALRTGTVNAAIALHEIESLGTVDVGKRADLLLLDANPLDDIRNVAHRVGVVLRGRWLAERELQDRLGAVARAVAVAERN